MQTPGQYPPVNQSAEWKVRQLLMEHHERSRVHGIPHDVSLETLKREISRSPELIEALRVIRQRASQIRMAQQRGMYQPGQPGQPYQHPNYHPNQSHVPASLRAAIPQYPGGPPGNYNKPPMPGMHQQYPGHQPGSPYNSYNQQGTPPLPFGQGGYSQPQPTITSRPPLIKQTLNAEMASSLIKQTGAAPDNAIDAIKAPIEEQASESQTESLDALPEEERKVETIMRQCEEISKKLRESLQTHLKSLLGGEKDEDDDVCFFIFISNNNLLNLYVFCF